MHATIHDSPFVSKAAARKLCEESGGEASTAWRREALAEFVVDETRALVPEFFANESTIVSEYTRPLEYDRYTVSDVGFVDLSATLFGSYIFEAAILYVENEHFAERATSRNLVAAHAKVEAATWPDPLAPFAKHEVWADAQAITRADLMDVSGRYHRQVNTKEPEEAVNKLRTGIVRHIRIHPRCKNLIAHLRHGIWNTARTGFERSEGLGHFDGVAALMYLWRHVDRNHNPVTPFIQSMVTHFVPLDKQVPFFANESQRQAAGMAKVFPGKRKRA